MSKCYSHNYCMTVAFDCERKKNCIALWDMLVKLHWLIIFYSKINSSLMILITRLGSCESIKLQKENKMSAFTPYSELSNPPIEQTVSFIDSFWIMWLILYHSPCWVVDLQVLFSISNKYYTVKQYQFV